MSSPEVEKFEITEEDLNLYPKRKKMSKNKAALGMWADSESDEENDRPKFSKRKGPKDYFAPVSFVSGGIKIGDKVTKEEEEDEITDSDEDEPVQPVKQPMTKKKGSSSYKQAKLPKDSLHFRTNDAVTRMMMKMGYQRDKGLGKNLQGISTPIEAVQRKGRGAIGLYGSEKSERAEQDFPTKPTSDEEEEKEFRQKLQRWKKGEVQQKRKVKYTTVDELIAAGAGKKRSRDNNSDISKEKIIDMTGKEQRVLSGYHALWMKHDKPSEDDVPQRDQEKLFDLPELLHNLDLLVDMAGEEIIGNNNKLKYESDMCVNLEHEHERLVKLCEEEEERIARMTDVIKIVDECEKCQKLGGIESLQVCAKNFTKLQEDYYIEYAMHDLSSMAVAIVFPLVKKVFEGWNPLKNPRQGIEIMKQWKDILERDNQPTYNQGLMSSQTMLPYDRLFWEVFMPPIRNTILNNWNVHYPDALVAMLEMWRPLVPEWILANVLTTLVYPKLQVEVENWNPLTDLVAIHTWVHPWLPLMADQLEPLYIPIRQKLANALTKWHPSDRSAKLILQPWAGVFNPNHMNVFLAKNIVPKLALCMQEFVINPLQQQMDAWNWVISWLDIISPVSMVKVLTENFFPRWIAVLSKWLSSNPNFDELTKWYLGWKSMFPEQLLTDPAVKNCLNEALEIMNQAVMEHSQPGARENIAYLTLTERRRAFEPERRDVPENNPSLSLNFTSIPTTLKEHIEQRAEESGLLFMPIPNKTYEGRQVYKLGRIQISIDQTMIHYNVKGQWNMTGSVETVINKAE